MIIIILALFGLALGSFINALVWRVRQQETATSKEQGAEYSILKGRSMCPQCKHKLSTADLVPVLSWVRLRGRCRYCQKPISWQYPAVELSTAALFVLSYIFWPAFQRLSLETVDVIGFGIWLVVLTGLVALAVYDLRWMLLPNRIIFPLFWLAGLAVLLESAITYNLEPIASAALGALVGGGIFYVLFQMSKGRWIGGGDVKLGFLLGVVAGNPWLAFLMLFLASLVGVFVSLPLLAAGKVKRDTHIPFGPFLIASAIIVQLFGTDLIDWYQNYFVIQ